MRAWMYQLNPDKGSRLTVEDRAVPSTTENLFACFEDDGWLLNNFSIRQFFAEAEPGDPVLIRIGGRTPAGVVALGSVDEIVQDEDRKWLINIDVNEKASAILRKDPIPYEWTQAVIPKSLSNLVKLEPHWAEIEKELNARGIACANAALMDSRKYPFGSDFELEIHLAAERSPFLRQRVLSARERPFRCEVCSFSFEESFGEEYADCVVLHYKGAVDGLTFDPSPAALAVLCANCHTALHWHDAAAPREVAGLQRRSAAPATRGTSELSLDEPNSEGDHDEFPVDTDSPGSTAVFVFEPRDPAALERAFLRVAGIAARCTSAETWLHTGDYIRSVDGLGHLVLDSFFGPPKWLIGISGNRTELERLLLSSQSQGVGAVAAGLAEPPLDSLGLVARLALADGTAWFSKADLASTALDHSLSASGVRVCQVEGLYLDAAATGHLPLEAISSI